VKARWLVAAALAFVPGMAAAEEPAGCDGFKWPLEHERAALADSGKASVANGGGLSYDAAATLKLAPLAEAGLPHAPERAPRSPQSYAGHFAMSAPARPGLYKITIASEGWIDVVDEGRFLHPKAFSGPPAAMAPGKALNSTCQPVRSISRSAASGPARSG
jgi:hypothetical protein